MPNIVVPVLAPSYQQSVVSAHTLPRRRGGDPPRNSARREVREAGGIAQSTSGYARLAGCSLAGGSAVHCHCRSLSGIGAYSAAAKEENLCCRTGRLDDRLFSRWLRIA